MFAAAVALTAPAIASPSGGHMGSKLGPKCFISTPRTSACRLIVEYFGAVNTGHTRKACSLLGRALWLQTGGRTCPQVLSMSRGTPFELLDTRTTPKGVAILLKVGLHELDHYRMLSWTALVGREAGKLRILETRLSSSGFDLPPPPGAGF
jgi:hypothetical protein